jgi:hypothetical protein
MALDFQVVHWRSIDNGVSDALSRPSCLNNIELYTEASVVRGKKHPASKTERSELIHKTHALGHFGLQQVFLKLWHEGYWWPNIREDIEKG